MSGTTLPTVVAPIATCPVLRCREKQPKRPDQSPHWKRITSQIKLLGKDESELPNNTWVCCRHGQHIMTEDDESLVLFFSLRRVSERCGIRDPGLY